MYTDQILLVIGIDPWEKNDIGNEPELFQYIKQLWHTVGYFG